MKIATRESIRSWIVRDSVLATALFAFHLLLYTSTLAPTITTASSDNAELIVQAARLEAAHSPGSPLFTLLGHLFSLLPFGEIATRINFMSAICGSITLALFYLLAVRHLSLSRLSATLAALFLGLSTIFWSQAVIAELYMPNLALLTFSILSLFEWAATRRSSTAQAHLWQARIWLILSFAGFAASLGVHLSNVLYLPALAIFVLLGLPNFKREGPVVYAKQVAKSFDLQGAALALLAGMLLLFLPYLWLYFALDNTRQAAGVTPLAPGWPRFSDFVFNAWSTWRFYYGFPYLPEHIAIFLRQVFYSFGAVGIGLALLGIWPLARAKPRIAITLGLLLLANLVFYLTYRAPDVQVFYLPAFWVIACFIGAGLDLLLGWLVKIAPQVKPGRVALAVPAFLLLIVSSLLLSLPQSYKDNNLTQDVHLRDFYANVFSELPQGTQYYQRGGVSYPMLYYTQLYGVRPDMSVFAGSRFGEPTDQPWPESPTFSGSTSRDIDLPAFIANPGAASGGSVTKWFEPFLFGMYGWNTPLMLTETGWLKTYEVLPMPPQDWLLTGNSDGSKPSMPLTVTLSPSLTLLGIDADTQAAQGRPWRMVRYWRATGADLPYVAISLIDSQGSHVAVEFNVPLNKQLRDYITARGISEADLPNYVLREEIRLVLPSYAPPGKYSVTVSLITGQLAQQLYDPALEGNMLPNEQQVAQLDLQPAPAPDPLNLPVTP